VANSCPQPQLKLKHLSADVDHATIRNPQTARSGERKVEQAAGHPRSAVGDGNDYRLPGRKIGYANFRAERQAAVGCGEQIPIEPGTARCFPFPIRIVWGLSGEASLCGEAPLEGSRGWATGRLSSARRLRVPLLSLAGGYLGSRLCVCLRNDGPQGLCSSRVHMHPDPRRG